MSQDSLESSYRRGGGDRADSVSSEKLAVNFGRGAAETSRSYRHSAWQREMECCPTVGVRSGPDAAAMRFHNGTGNG